MTFSFRSVMVSTCFLIAYAHSVSAELPLREKSQSKFEYEMSSKDAQKLESGVAGLKKGMSLDTVMIVLGKPDSERVLYTKKFFGGGKFVSKKITYVLKRVQINNNNVNDHVINLYFDRNNLLTEAERLGYSVTGVYEVLGGIQIREKIL